MFFVCEIPIACKNEVPKAISLQPSQNESFSCESIEENSTNLLRVLKYKKSKNNQIQKSNQNKYSIGVCVQALRFANYEYSVRMIEWLEMVRILGADKVYIYIHDATKSLKKVLRHYQKMVTVLLFLNIFQINVFVYLGSR